MEVSLCAGRTDTCYGTAGHSVGSRVLVGSENSGPLCFIGARDRTVDVVHDTVSYSPFECSALEAIGVEISAQTDVSAGMLLFFMPFLFYLFFFLLLSVVITNKRTGVMDKTWNTISQRVIVIRLSSYYYYYYY